MKFISHRGNLEGTSTWGRSSTAYLENTPEYIDVALQRGFDVEVDVWYNKGRFFLGHDKPLVNVTFGWLLKRAPHLWVHCKNAAALDFFSTHQKMHHFWHQKDWYTLTSNKYIWTYPGNTLYKSSILVMPEDIDFTSDRYSVYNNVFEYCLDQKDKIYGICSDNISLIRDRFE